MRFSPDSPLYQGSLHLSYRRSKSAQDYSAADLTEADNIERIIRQNIRHMSLGEMRALRWKNPYLRDQMLEKNQRGKY